MSDTIFIMTRMEEELFISYSKDKHQITLAYKTDTGYRKEALSVSDKTLEYSLKTLRNNLKKIVKFKYCGIHYEPVDYYDNHVNTYTVPYGYYRKGEGKRKVTIKYNEHYAIPKAWIETVVASFDYGTSTKPIELFLDSIGITDESSRNEFMIGAKKVLKKKDNWFQLLPYDVRERKYTFNVE